MNPLTLRLALFAVLVGLVTAWSKEDYEIFRLNDEVTAAEGTNVTFYDFLGAQPNANQDDLNKAYRKKSRLLHPDKVKRAFISNTANKDKANPQKANQGSSKREIDDAVKKAHERSARLNVVANILRGSSRERYDYFLKNGFPKWKGTGYYYSRFRPGLGSVAVGLLLVFGGAGHYAALVLGWKRQREFVDRYIRQARRAAWGDELGVRGIPGVDANATAPVPPPGSEGDGEATAMPVNRRQKRMMDRENKKDNKKGPSRASRSTNNSAPATPTTESPPSTGERKRVIAENGKVLIVDSIGNVYLEETTEDGERKEFLLDIGEIQKPSIRDTMIFCFPGWFFQKTIGRVFSKSDDGEYAEEETAAEQIAEENSSAVASNNGGSSRRRGKRSQRS